MPYPNDATLIDALRGGDEDAFSTLISTYHAPLVRTAALYVNSPTVAEEVVQDTWIAVLKGLERFEGRSLLKTWLFSIAINRAKTTAQREGRYDVLAEPEDTDEIPAVASDRFRPTGQVLQGHWVSQPQDWDAIPEERLLSLEIHAVIHETIERLPFHQRAVILLRDIEGISAEEVRDLLDVTDGNQRVLLHRARARVRQALETYFEEAH
ncbi:MAG: sigma-70 family RNA polymerase sigma factor [Chloroflexota bacterium]|nr:sigma-70 family RNA polymerase sigma factor [Chloroflexota bacterium]